MASIIAFIGRLLIAILFIVSGCSKLGMLGQVDATIVGAGLPAGLALPTAIFEIVAGLALALGFMTRLVAFLLAGFTLLATLFFHNQFTDPMQSAMALKNLAITGGLLMVIAQRQMAWGYDTMRARRKGEIEARDANAKLHDAELRAARAEGRADGATTVAPTRTVATDVNGDGVADTTTTKKSWF